MNRAEYYRHRLKEREFIQKAHDERDAHQLSSITDIHNKGIFDGVDIISLSINTESRLTSHTLENGMVVSENQINLQNKISARVVCSDESYTSIYKNISYARRNCLAFVIQTKVDTYENMYISSCNYVDSSSVQRAVIIEINFIEQQYVKYATETLEKVNVSQEKDVDTPPPSTYTPDDVDDPLRDKSRQFFDNAFGGG